MNVKHVWNKLNKTWKSRFKMNLFFVNNFWDKKIAEVCYKSSVVKISKKGRKISMIHSGMTSDTAARTLLRDNEVFASSVLWWRRSHSL